MRSIVSLLLVVWLLIFIAIIFSFVIKSGDQAMASRCSTIGANDLIIRGAHICVKPDGSLWQVPNGENK